MKPTDILQAEQAAKQARQTADEAVKAYRQTLDNPDSTVEELKEACNAAVRALADLADRQTELSNALKVAGQLMSDYIKGKQPGPKS